LRLQLTLETKQNWALQILALVIEFQESF
jgi:hypothetical protein